MVYSPTFWLIFLVHVGKYTSHMDPSWDRESLQLQNVSFSLFLLRFQLFSSSGMTVLVSTGFCWAVLSGKKK